MCIFFIWLQHTPLEKLDRKHFAKGSRGPEKNGVAAPPQEVGNLKDIALMEAKMQKLCALLEEVSIFYLFSLSLSFLLNVICLVLLGSYLLIVSIVVLFYFWWLLYVQVFIDLVQTIERTKQNVEKKQALTYEEMEAEREEVS